MRQIPRIAAACAATLLISAAAPPGNPPPAVPKVLDIFQRLQVAEAQKAQKLAADRVRFRLTEAEVNEYARYALETKPRPGVESVAVKIFAQNYYSTYTVIDFDAVERWKPGTVPTLLKPVLSGKRSIWVDYRVQTNAGLVTFTVEKARFEGVPLPAFFVQKMIEVLAARQPEHFDTSKPVPLPFGLQKVWTADKMVMCEN